jgi:hypothetical protein
MTRAKAVGRYCVFCSPELARKDGGGYICNKHAVVLKENGFQVVAKLAKGIFKNPQRIGEVLDKFQVRDEAATKKKEMVRKLEEEKSVEEIEIPDEVIEDDDDVQEPPSI